jgi:hypothetical protein
MAVSVIIIKMTILFMVFKTVDIMKLQIQLRSISSILKHLIAINLFWFFGIYLLSVIIFIRHVNSIFCLVIQSEISAVQAHLNL